MALRNRPSHSSPKMKAIKAFCKNEGLRLKVFFRKYKQYNKLFGNRPYSTSEDKQTQGEALPQSAQLIAKNDASMPTIKVEEKDIKLVPLL